MLIHPQLLPTTPNEQTFVREPLNIDVSVVLLTYNQTPSVLEAVARSVLEQTSVQYELIIADNGCLDSTTKVVSKIFNKTKPIGNGLGKLKYIQQRHNPGYANGNNFAVKATSASSQWILFLNDDIFLHGEFISSMHRLASHHQKLRSHGFSVPEVGAVGCKLVTKDGETLLEAGSLIWKGAKCAGYGHENTNPGQAEFHYVRPVDYISGACLMVNKTDFLQYGGFDGNTFKAYYEDTDLQMHIQHDLKKDILF
jgi:GT2 family glycosyltransferase